MKTCTKFQFPIRFFFNICYNAFNCTALSRWLFCTRLQVPVFMTAALSLQDEDGTELLAVAGA